MLDYQKLILKKVSFDEVLFKKELQKSQKWLSPEELSNLHKWAKKTFGFTFSKIISEALPEEAA